MKSCWTPTGTVISLHPKHNKLEEEKSGHYFLLWHSGQVRITSLWVLWDKGSKYFHWLLLRAELEPCTARVSPGIWLRGFGGGCAAPSGRPKGADPLEATADWTYCASGWVTSSPSPNLAARLKLWRKIQHLIKPFPLPLPLFLCFTSTFRMKSLKAKRKPGKWWSQPSYIQESAWGRPRFNPLFYLANLEFAFPTTKKNNPTAELLRDVFGYLETFLGICHAWFLWSQFLFVGSAQILIEQKRRTVRGTTWYSISSQKYGGNLLHFLLFALQ